MPLVQIALRAGMAPADQRAIADGVHQALVETINLPPVVNIDRGVSRQNR